MPHEISILLLHGDAEAQLLADGEAVVQAVLPGREVKWTSAWATRPDWLDPHSPAPPESFRRNGILADVDVRELLEQPYSLVIFPLLPCVATPSLRHRDGGRFLAHRGMRAGWTPRMTALVEAECTEEPSLSPSDAAVALAPLIERLQARGSSVAVCTAFRHVKEPLHHRSLEGTVSLREAVRRTNLEALRLSRRTGCFVFDIDRPLAQEGGDAVQADCFGGGGRAAELALDELAALIMDAVPDAVAQLENA